MPTLIGYAIRHSLAGLEWAAGIPGTVAGCVVMNAGTRLGEMKHSVKAVRMVTPTGAVIERSAREIKFAYRRTPCRRASLWAYGCNSIPASDRRLRRS